MVFFHQTFVKQLNWLDDQQYAQLVALAQILPGPTSSQVGLAIGYMKKGYWGAVLAWLGFTLPSALLMTLVALLGEQFFPLLSSAFFHSIQLIVLAVVTWAFWQMLRSFLYPNLAIHFNALFHPVYLYYFPAHESNYCDFYRNISRYSALEKYAYKTK